MLVLRQKLLHMFTFLLVIELANQHLDQARCLKYSDQDYTFSKHNY